MNKCFLYVFVLILALGISSAELRVIEDRINITIKGYILDANNRTTDFINLTILTEDGLLSWDSLTGDSDIYEEKEINLIRNIDCDNGTDLVSMLANLKSCDGVDCYKAWVEQGAAKSIVETNKQICDKELADQNIKLEALTNETEQCKNIQTSLDQKTNEASVCNSAKITLETEKKDLEQGKLIYGGIGIIIGAAGYYLSGRKTKDLSPKHFATRDGRPPDSPSLDVGIPERLRR